MREKQHLFFSTLLAGNPRQRHDNGSLLFSSFFSSQISAWKCRRHLRPPKNNGETRAATATYAFLAQKGKKAYRKSRPRRFGNPRSAEFRHRRIQAYSGSLVRSIKSGPMRNSRIKWQFLRTLQLPQKNPNFSKKSTPPNLLSQILYIFPYPFWSISENTKFLSFLS